MPWNLLTLLGILLVLMLVLCGCYLVTRWAGTGMGGRFTLPGAGAHMRVLERMAVGRDQALLVVQLGKRTFLLGSSPSGFSLLAELTEEEGALWAVPPPPRDGAGRGSADFRDMLRRFREKK